MTKTGSRSEQAITETLGHTFSCFKRETTNAKSGRTSSLPRAKGILAQSRQKDRM